MASKTYSQTFSGYWRYINRAYMPEKSGIYCVYAGTYNKTENNVILNRLLYIGQSENINERLKDHECESEWKKELKSGEEIIFSCTKLGSYDLDRFEAAMIYKHKPPVNIEYKYNFPFDETTVYTSGENALLYSSFTVYRTDSRSTLLGGR